MRRLDRRLGTNADLREVCEALNEAGFRIMFDGVFNHVGRGFWAFQDVLRNRENSPYKDWFHVRFDGNNDYDDGLWYEGWEGHFNLVKLNLRHPEVVDYIFESIREWREDYKISGLRLDVAYCLDRDFLRQLRAFTDTLAPDFFLLGEMIHGDYNTIMNEAMCHSATNYENARSLLSALNSRNLFEIAHNLQRQFNDEPWALFNGVQTLLSFVDNHDIARATTVLNDPRHLPLAYAISFAQPGIPAIYYGSEWGAKGDNRESDWDIRQSFAHPEWNDLTDHLAKLTALRTSDDTLAYGSYRTVHLTNEQFIFERRVDDRRLLIGVNLADHAATCHCDMGCAFAVELLTGGTQSFDGGVDLPSHAAKIWRPEPVN